MEAKNEIINEEIKTKEIKTEEIKEIKKDRIIGMLGLAEKAGKLVTGESKALEAIRSGKALICIVAADASDNTKKLFHDKCAFNKVPICEYGTKIKLGHASMVVCDENFAKGINKLMTDLEGKIES